jgi:hypothetical protein
MKKIDIKKLKSFRINKKVFLRFLGLIARYKRLIFIIFWGIILIYSFNILYKKVYIDIQFIGYDNIRYSSTGKEMSILGRISSDIESRHKKQQEIKDNFYRDPFKFIGEVDKTVNQGEGAAPFMESNFTPGQW